MRYLIRYAFLLILPLAQAGCSLAPSTGRLPAKVDKNSSRLSAYTHYVPARVDIMPLTEFTSGDSDQSESRINVYVSLLDLFGCQMKSPAMFRFELYEKLRYSGEPKGKRITIWPDINLTDETENNNYWRDFLRAYEFNLKSELPREKDCLLQVTCMCPSGKRLSAEFAIKKSE